MKHFCERIFSVTRPPRVPLFLRCLFSCAVSQSLSGEVRRIDSSARKKNRRHMRCRNQLKVTDTFSRSFVLLGYDLIPDLLVYYVDLLLKNIGQQLMVSVIEGKIFTAPFNHV